MPLRLFVVPSLLITATPALAEVPNVVTDFGPTQGIVAQVMAGAGSPTALLSGADTPHSFSLRPSHANALSNADVVVWIGHSMTPWLEEPLENLAPNAVKIELLETKGWDPLEVREGSEAHDDHDDHGDHDDHADEKDDHDHDHDAKEDHNHGDAHTHDDDHADAHDDHDTHAGHVHEGDDPHAWLDPDIAAVWAMAVAEALSEIDPENATIYRENANQFWADAALLGQEIATQIDATAPATILVAHDNTQYFEARFGFEPAGFIAESDAAEPGPAHLRDLKEHIAEGEITCILADIETNPGTLDLLTDGTDVATATLDVTDVDEVGYIGMMRGIVDTFKTCTN